MAHFVETPLGQDDLDHVLSMIANGSKLQWVVFAFRGSWWRDYLKEKGLANFDSVNINFHSEFGQVAFVTVNIDEELRNRLLQSRTSQVRSFRVRHSVLHSWEFVLTSYHD